MTRKFTNLKGVRMHLFWELSYNFGVYDTFIDLFTKSDQMVKSEN